MFRKFRQSECIEDDAETHCCRSDISKSERDEEEVQMSQENEKSTMPTLVKEIKMHTYLRSFSGFLWRDEVE